MRTLNICFCLIFFLTMHLNTFQELTQTLRGTVIDAESLIPIPFVTGVITTSEPETDHSR